MGSFFQVGRIFFLIFESERFEFGFFFAKTRFRSLEFFFDETTEHVKKHGNFITDFLQRFPG